MPYAVLLLIMPETVASLLLEAPPGWRIALCLPAILLPGLLALGRLALGRLGRLQRRAAIGLGASRLDRLRWLWLPQLGPGIGISLGLAVGFGIAIRMLR